MSDDLSIPNPTYRVPRRGRRGGLDPAMRRLMIYAGGVVGVLAVIGGASLLFDRHTGPVPVVQADSRPMRVKPENPGGMQITGLGDDVGDNGKGKLAPAPETPNPKALRAAAAQETPAPPPAALTTPTGTTPTGTAPTATALGSTTAAPTAAPAPSPRVAAAATPKPAPAAPASATPAVAAAVPPAPTPAPAPVARTAAKPVPATSGHAAVQLAALSSEEAAKVEWQRMEKRMPDLLGGHSPTYTKVERDGHVFWRVRVAGFGDLAQAKAFCERVRAKGAGCSVADF